MKLPEKFNFKEAIFTFVAFVILSLIAKFSQATNDQAYDVIGKSPSVATQALSDPILKSPQPVPFK